MPTYDFRCPAGHNTERFYRKISDAPAELACPDCGELAVRQVSGGAGLVFKGSGFYITDYRSDSYKKAAEADKGGGAKSEKGSDPKSADQGSTKPDSSKPSSGSE
jgi:putative FmdB family regulatory protein